MRYLFRLAVMIGTGVLFADCGGSQSPIDPPVTMQQAPSSASASQPALLQRVARETGEVQYFSSFYGSGTLLEFDYPKSESPIGSLNFNGGGFCTKGARTFWVTGSDEVAEFKVAGNKPIRVLGTGPYTSGCAVDPATGDLAALNALSGAVTIFRNARGKGKVISGALGRADFGGYDNQSNLFVDGFNANYGFALVELEKGNSAFVTITTSNTVQFPGSVQWDGRYLAVTDQGAGAIYRYTVNGTVATLKRTVVLSGATDCAASWIAKRYVYCADAGNGDGEVFRYAAGGSPIATLAGMDLPLGVVSLRVR